MNLIPIHRRQVLEHLAMCSTAFALPRPLLAMAQGDEGPYQLPRSQHWRVARDGAPDLVLWATWPDTPPPETGWPLILMLDGEENFPLAAVTLQRRGQYGRDRGARPQAVLVGVSSGSLEQRIWDYTPPIAAQRLPTGVPGAGHRIGGADEFLQLLHQRILPQLAQRWHLNPARRTLIGHSFGGLLALYAGMKGPRDFSRLAAISPSCWYGDGLLRRMAQDTGPSALKALIAAGDHESGPDTASGASAALVAQQLQAKWGMVSWKPLGDLPHGATLQASLVVALDLALND
ncbi:alpha/beta hydrolase [Novosphingobium umbonatum]|uniref:Alpha/beta hydrolase n=1 Tax=Novosphingobium umbonatum TaxID=1908524 RepID=A0A437MX75_9SPHN|nr:alpha/beta hydrolase-fold protein [Novosphingobium umbonatum]RVU02260.1 alpha/beta hydrolase [Novosphingobium umbonatum]